MRLELIKTISMALLGYIAKSCWENRDYLWIFIKSKFYFKKRIRLSISYIFKIEIDDKYLLIKGKRIDQFQPVGGVFKTMESFESIKSELDIQNDNSIKRDGKISKDLRINTPSKNVVKVIKWFQSRKNREICVLREFKEELVESGFISSKVLNDFNPEYLKTVNTNILYSTHFQMHELLIYEIYTIVLNTHNKEIIKKKVKESDDLVLVTEDEINKECISCDGISRKIGAHSKHII